MAEKDEYKHQQQDLEKVCNPIITKLYQSAGGMPGGFPGGGGAPSSGGSSGPTIEEVDWSVSGSFISLTTKQAWTVPET